MRIRTMLSAYKRARALTQAAREMDERLHKQLRRKAMRELQEAAELREIAGSWSGRAGI